MRKRVGFLLILTSLIFNVSCLNRHFTEGRYEIVSITDTMLNGYSIFEGSVHQLDHPMYPVSFEVWLENSIYSTESDSTGHYSIKTMPGTYTIRCQSVWNEWERLIEEVRDIEILSNRKIRLDFYIGYATE